MANKPTSRSALASAVAGIADPGSPASPKPATKLRPSSLLDTRVIYCGDNLEQLKKLPDACVDLIYIDPPFNSNRNYEVFWGETKEKRAFADRHESTRAYIEYMRPRCVQLSRVLKKTGAFYYHCDWHASHYVKVMLDQIFGENNFRSEILWKRTSSHNDAKRNFGIVNDTIFYFIGGGDYTFHPQHDEHSEEYLDQFYRHTDKDGRRYMLDNMTSPNPRPNMMYEWKGFASPPKGWRYSKETMAQLDAEGRIWYPDEKTKRPRLKRYLDEMSGRPISNWWDDIPPIHSQAAERLGYPTQKPLGLLERIITASSNKNDIVLDAFCGCGTALVAAQQLKRQWIGIDISPTACHVMAKRLRDVCGMKDTQKAWRESAGFVVRDLPKTTAQLRKYPPFEFENWAVIALKGVPNKTKVGDMGIDGRIYPTDAIPKRTGKETGHLDFMDDWYPIQVKQKDKAGRPDIDQFEAVMQREDRKLGYFVAFDFTSDALFEIDRFQRQTGRTIKPLTVQEILDEEMAIRKPE